jgi:hypothetical protein
VGERRNGYKILMGKPDEKKPLGTPRRRWVDNIKMDIRKKVLGCVAWIDLTQDRDQWRVD